MELIAGSLSVGGFLSPEAIGEDGRVVEPLTVVEALDDVAPLVPGRALVREQGFLDGHEFGQGSDSGGEADSLGSLLYQLDRAVRLRTSCTLVVSPVGSATSGAEMFEICSLG